MRTQEELCTEIHGLLESLPRLENPSQVPFKNGLYFFYEQSETSAHAPQGRIVRVGNHPRSQDRLIGRLRDHYSGNKNSSVFRMLVGGAILRRANQSHPCLEHWEKHGMHTCEKCRPVELEVSKLLRERFFFRCVKIEDKYTRNRFERGLIATLSICPVCKPSAQWFGKLAHSEKVNSSGLWNNYYVLDQAIVLCASELQELGKLVGQSQLMLQHSV